jgi:lipopolysaccharide/colanic/teichoic acid biosynthesis glycosyltransferase
MELLINRILAFIAICILSPVFLLTAIGIYLSDPGPIFYKAKRAGYLGRPFFVIKFRSMRIVNSGSRITSTNDPRIFSFGKFIRLTKIDELPQLFNILLGQMAIVGPRPEDLGIVDKHYTVLLKESFKVLPGLASPGSLYNYTHIEDKLTNNNTEHYYINEIMPLKVAMDVVYARDRSFCYDFKIILKTIKIISLKILGTTTFPVPKEYNKAKELIKGNP